MPDLGWLCSNSRLFFWGSPWYGIRCQGHTLFAPLQAARQSLPQRYVQPPLQRLDQCRQAGLLHPTACGRLDILTSQPSLPLGTLGSASLGPSIPTLKMT